MDTSGHRVSDLSPERRALLERLLEEKGLSLPTADAADPVIRPQRDGDALPLSFAQQRLWFLDRLDRESARYNIPLAIRMAGPLDRRVLDRSLRAIIERHEILRTTFPALRDKPTQRISPDIAFRIVETDLAAAPAEDRERELERLREREALQPFDLDNGPLIRATLLRMADDEHVLLLTMHHIVSDGWSLGVLFRELSGFYQAFGAGRDPSLPALAVQYADFAQWQRRWLSGPVLDRQLRYWRERLAGLATLELATDRPRPPVQTYAGARVVHRVSGALTRRLRSFGHDSGATLFMTTLAAFVALLHRYTGQDDIAVGSLIANRNRAEIEGLIGFFVNTLVMRTDVSGDPSFRTLVRLVREAALGAYDHQDLPFEKLVEELAPERDLSRNPLVQVTFAVQNARTDVADLGEVRLSRLGSCVRTTRFDLEVHLWEDDDDLRVWFIYNTDLFEAGTIERMADHYVRLLGSAVSAPDRPVSELALLDADERRRLVAGFNDTTRPYRPDATVAALFAGQAARTPDAVAVESEGSRLSYAELDAAANRLANHLRRLGVGAGMPVAICLARGIDMVVGVLAVLKAGGAYVPLDPDYPETRIAFMLADSGATVALTTAGLADRLAGYDGRIVRIDAEHEAIAAESADAPDCGASADTLAYVIYTSGSTGTPKGVAMPHRALVNLLGWQIARPGFAPRARTLQFTTLSFDVSAQEIFSTWCSGGTLVTITEAVRRDPQALADFIAAERINRLFLPFVALQHLADAVRDGQRTPADLREVITAGEQLRTTPALVRLFERLPGCTLCNQYGPSETHVATSFDLEGAPGSWPPLPPIGRPIANTRVYVLDSRMQPVPVGVPGELHIAGDGLARGYLNRAEMTAERFVADPFSEAPGARMYRTGDRVRWRSDGNIEFLGRTDHQVKLRGYRIELGEIETVLCRHPSVAQAAAAVREIGSDRRLVAYFVGGDDDPEAERALRAFLGERLPDYMVPSFYQRLDALPLTPSGKLDRAALPVPGEAALGVERAYVAPRTPVERALAAVWSELLGLDEIGVRDNFFDLGGHSLLATQVMSRIREALDVDLPLAELFAHPSVEGLADCVENARWVRDGGARAPLAAVAGGVRQEGEL